MKTQDYNLDNKENTPWRLFTPEGAGKEFCVLWIQGWSSSMDSHREGVERMSKKSSVPFATLDYAGHGLSTIALEESTRKQQHEEVAALFDQLKKEGYEKIIVIGGSFGGYMAALLAGERPAHAAVLRVPAMYADDEFELAHNKTRKWENPDLDQQYKKDDPYIKDNTAVRAINSFDGFVYVLEHELDEVVPRNMPQGYYSAAKHGNYLIVPNTKHSPKLMKNPQPHFDYIEHWVVAIIEAIKLQELLT